MSKTEEKFRKPILSVTASDCRWEYYRGSGKGGQKRNKTSNCVRCTHEKSGAQAYSEDGRSQRHNKEDAFRKMVNTEKFQNWLRIEVMRVNGELAIIEEKVNREIRNIKIETKKNGVWVEENDEEEQKE